jgi:hypothetical protein
LTSPSRYFSPYFFLGGVAIFVSEGADAATFARLHQLNAIFAIFGASDRDKSLDLKGRGLRNRL